MYGGRRTLDNLQVSGRSVSTVNPIGSTLQGRYQILERLGSNGAVTTYLASDLRVPGNLQLKCVVHRYELPDAPQTSDRWERTLLSAQMLDRISDKLDRLPTVYAYFVEDEAFYLVREFIRGVPLAQELIPEQPWTESRLVMLLIDLLEILQEIDRCEVIPAPLALDPLIRRNVDRKLVSVDLPLVTSISPYSADTISPTQRDLHTIGEIAIAAASGLASTDLPLTANHTAQWQQLAIHIRHPELIAILTRLTADNNTEDAYPSSAVALQAVVKVMSKLLTQPQQPTNNRVEIAKHLRLLVERGDRFYETGDCQQAIEAYDRALSVEPKSIDALCGRGNARRYIGDYQGSWDDFNTAIDLDPQRGIAYIGRALSSRFGQHLEASAIGDFERGKELLAQPQAPIEYVMLGTAKAQLGDSNGAIVNYTTAISLNPRLVVAYNNRGNLRQYLGDMDGALADFSTVLAIDSRSPIAYNNRAIVYSHLTKFDEAIADYSRALALQPNFTSVYNNRANAYCQMGDYAAAIADYTKSIEFDPTFAVAYSNRGNIYRIQGELTAALADYDRAIDLDPNLIIAYYNRGICQRQLGNHQAAIDDYTKTLALDPQYYYAYYHRANARQYLGDKRGAIADFTQTIRFDPQHVNAHYNRAVTRCEMDDIQGAMEDLDVALQLQPTFALGFYQRGAILASVGEHELAIEDFQQAIDLQPTYLNAYYQRGIVRQNSSDLTDAIADFNYCLNLDANYAPAYYQRAKVNLQLGDRSGAIADYHKAANLYLDRGDSKTYQQIIQILDRISGV
jgi:tetratricopeptide (TPR) repeat protein